MNLLTPDDLNVSNLLGYGPLVSDLETGEILSSTANVYLSQFYHYIKASIYRYIQAKGGLVSSYRDHYNPIEPASPFSFSYNSLRNQFFAGSLKKMFLPSYMIHSWNPYKKSYNSIDKNSIRTGGACLWILFRS